MIYRFLKFISHLVNPSEVFMIRIKTWNDDFGRETGFVDFVVVSVKTERFFLV